MAKKRKAEKKVQWLFKEEPDHYSYDDLENDGETVWDGIKNNTARMHLREVKKGDRVWYYHTGKEKAIVGEMEVIRGPYADPESEDAKAVVVDVKPVRRWSRPVTLAQIKAQEELANWALVRISRLSIVPVDDVQWEIVTELRRANEEARVERN